MLTALHTHPDADLYRQKRAGDCRTSDGIKVIVYRTEASYDSKCATEWREMQVDTAAMQGKRI
jgi:hypothetical protein